MNYEQLLKILDIDREKLNSININPLMREEINNCLEIIIIQDEGPNIKKKTKQKKLKIKNK